MGKEKRQRGCGTWFLIGIGTIIVGLTILLAIIGGLLPEKEGVPIAKPQGTNADDKELATACEQFEVQATLDAVEGTLAVRLDTDLSDNVLISLSVSRTYSVLFENGKEEDYSCEYASEVGVPVSTWRSSRSVSLDPGICRAEIEEHERQFDELATRYRQQDMPEVAAEMAFAVEQIEDDVEVRAVQVFGQGICPDPTEDRVTFTLPLR